MLHHMSDDVLLFYTSRLSFDGQFDAIGLDFDEVFEKYDDMMKWLAGVYVNTLNIIHYMHDKYCYEKIQMALHDTYVDRFMAFGVAGLSVITDSLSAITPSTTPST